MTRTEDLIAKLRDTASRGVSSWGDLQQEAADHIAAQDLLIEVLKKQLSATVAAEREACAKLCEDNAEALKLALEALEGADSIDVDMQDAIAKCKEALAQPPLPVQEPELPEFYAELEYNSPDVFACVYRRRADNTPELVHREQLPVQELSYAGVRMWVGDRHVVRCLTELEFTRSKIEPLHLLELAAGRCLKEMSNG
jgi:hypothetical protein